MNLLQQLEAEHIAELGKTIPDFSPGDTIRVGFRVTEGTRTRIQNYEGVCISRKGGDRLAASFTVRKISFGEGVERVFPLYSPQIAEITVVRRGQVRRASASASARLAAPVLAAAMRSFLALSSVIYLLRNLARDHRAVLVRMASAGWQAE